MTFTESYISATLNLNSTPSFTDLSRWRLRVDQGAQTWHYLEDDQECELWPQAIWDKYHLGLPTGLPELTPAKTPLECAVNGFEFYRQIQTEDGHWAGEYGGPMFTLPGLIIIHYITGTPVREATRLELIRYLLNRAHKDDGGWGLHIEGSSTVFGTSLNYVALRILGLGPEHSVMVKARNTLHKLGGAAAVPTWGKFFLSALGVYEWEGMNPIPPELWTLPKWIPLSPANWWVQARLVYLPMGYIYARRLSAPLTDFTQSLRSEIYTQPYNTIVWDQQRNNVAKVDLYTPRTKLMDGLNNIATYYEKIPYKANWLRQYAIQEVIEQIKMEDENSFFLDIGPVNKVMNWLVVYYHYGKDSREFKLHVERNQDFLWMGPEGMMMNGTNGSQLWDATFIAQACVEAQLADNDLYRKHMIKLLEFIDLTQIKRDAPNMERCYRHKSKGAWPFSTRDHGYTVSDCTAEGLKSVIALQQIESLPQLVSLERMRDAVDVLLTMQNSDYGFASYERIRGPPWLEKLNTAEVFRNIMIEFNYVECSTAVLMGLAAFRKLDPVYRRQDIDRVTSTVLQYIKKEQRSDGSWYGSWAICFTNGAFFALQSLASYIFSKGMRFFTGQTGRRWWVGETYKSCENQVYTHNSQSQVVNTAWAIMSLLEAKYPEEEPIRRGVQFIMKRQQDNGEWLQESIEGVFNKNCMISYPNYKFSFTIWALGKYALVYGNKPLLD
ncbi:unnamed protein product [Absidia cylindrospora]